MEGFPLGDEAHMPNLNAVLPSEIDRILSSVNDTNKRATLLATMCRINTLYMIARAGSGHIGSSFSCLDMVAWLYLNRVGPIHGKTLPDLFFSSKGHDAPALYSVLIALKLLPFEKIHSLRRLDGLPGHPDISIPHISTNTGSLGMGISKAKGLIQANRISGTKQNIFVMTGDGELQEGQIWESLMGATNAGMHELTVIVDHNKIQSDHWVSSTSDLGRLDERFKSFGWNVLRCDGHDTGQFSLAVKETDTSDKPSVIIADTIKGFGVSYLQPTELGDRDFYQFHSGALSQDNYAQAIEELCESANKQLKNSGSLPLNLETYEHEASSSLSPRENLIPAYSEALLKGGQENKNIVVLDADLVLDCGLVPFRETFPERYIECGIAEMDMVSQAGGLALAGKLPIVHSFACFLTPRANEQIYNNASERTKVIYVGGLAGVLPAGPGHSHQSVRDIALMSCIPNLIAIEPHSAEETKIAVNWMLNHTDQICYLRLTSIPVSLGFTSPEIDSFTPGQGTIIRDGTDGTILAYGPVMLAEAVAAAQLLEHNQDLKVRVINFPWLNLIDSEWLCEILNDTSYLMTVDNHYLSGGVGERVATTLMENGLSGSLAVKRVGINEVPVCGTNEEALSFHGLDRDSLSKSFLELRNDRKQNQF